MNLLAFLPFLSLAWAYDTIRPGTLYISSVGNIPSHKDLAMENGRLVVSSSLSTFDYDPKGSLELQDAGKYLAVSASGKVVLASKPQRGFSFKTEPHSRYTRVLHWDSYPVFELCGDSSIGYNSNCEGARNVTIVYEDIIQPR